MNIPRKKRLILFLNSCIIINVFSYTSIVVDRMFLFKSIIHSVMQF